MRFERPLGRVEVEGDLGRMHFQGELHAALAEHVENRIEPLGEQLEAGVDHRLAAPAGTSTSRCQMLEPVKPLTTPTPSFWAARAVFFSSSAARLVDAGRVAVAPDVRRQDRLVPLRRSCRSTAWPTRWVLIAWHCRS